MTALGLLCRPKQLELHALFEYNFPKKITASTPRPHRGRERGDLVPRQLYQPSAVCGRLFPRVWRIKFVVLLKSRSRFLCSFLPLTDVRISCYSAMNLRLITGRDSELFSTCLFFPRSLCKISLALQPLQTQR